MVLNKYLPPLESWSLSKSVIYYKKLQRIPVCLLIGGVPHIILENKIPKQVIELTRRFMTSGESFYFTTPLSANPAGVENFQQEVIMSYLIAYSNPKFLHGFRRLGFDLVKNLIDWSEKNGAWPLVKGQYEEMNRLVQKNYYDYFQKIEYYDYSAEIREEFRCLWREIQISKII